MDILTQFIVNDYEMILDNVNEDDLIISNVKLFYKPRNDLIKIPTIEKHFPCFQTKISELNILSRRKCLSATSVSKVTHSFRRSILIVNFSGLENRVKKSQIFGKIKV